MRRIVRGKPLLVVTAAATAALMAGCSPVSGNLAALDTGPAPDGGRPDTSVVSGNLDLGLVDASHVSGNLSLAPDAGTDAAPLAPADANTDANADGGS